MREYHLNTDTASSTKYMKCKLKQMAQDVIITTCTIQQLTNRNYTKNLCFWPTLLWLS